MLDHEKLDVYTVALQLANASFDIADQLPKGYGSLADQLRRAATSVPANIAEACGRQHGKDRQRFMLKPRRLHHRPEPADGRRRVQRRVLTRAPYAARGGTGCSSAQYSTPMRLPLRQTTWHAWCR